MRVVCILLKTTLLLLYVTAQHNGNITNVVDVLIDILTKEIFPVKLTSFTCWNQESNKNIIKSLSSHKISMSINNIGVPYHKKSIYLIAAKEDQFYLVDYACPYSKDILMLADKTGLFMFPYRWIILRDCFSLINFNTYFFPVSSRVYILYICEDEADLVSLYQVAENKPQLKNDVGKWKNNIFVKYRRINDFNDRRNLHKIEFNVTMAFIDNASIPNLEAPKQTGIDSISKQCFALFHHTVEMLNITPNLRIRNSWGYRNPETGKYNDVYGDLQRGECEYSPSSSFQVRDRLAFVDYIGEPVFTVANFFFRKPSLSTISNIYSLPFTSHVWYSMYGLIGIFFICVYVIIKWERMQPKDSFDGNVKQLQDRALDVLQMQAGAVFQQGSEAEPRSGAGKLATFFIFLSLMFLFTAYSANIVTLLQSTSDNIDTLQDLLNFKVEIGAQENPFSRLIFTRMLPTEDHKKISKKVKYHETRYGMQRARTELYAFHVEPTVFYYEMGQTFEEHEKCGFKSVNFINNRPLIPVHKTSNYKELLRAIYSKFIENGIRNRYERIFYSSKPICSEVAKFESVGISDCYFAPMALGIGMILAFVILGIETLYYKYSIAKNGDVVHVMVNSNTS